MQHSSSESGNDEIVVYWRPGCGYCSSLLRDLDGLTVRYRAINIWNEPDASGAAIVRSLARGHETVPTAVIGGIGLVNPTAHDVVTAALQYAPGAVPDGYVAPEPGRLSKWLGSKLG
jgi:glutaredoxin